MPHFPWRRFLSSVFFSAEFIVSEAVPIPPTSLSEDMSRSAAEAASFLKSLSHEQRLMILCHLCSGEKSVGELMEHLGLRQAATSQMLARLREDGLVQNRRDGKMIFYRLASGETAEVIGLLHRLFCEKPRSAADLQKRAPQT